jgi:hypothetical protein
MEIELRSVLLVREHSRDEPTLSLPQFQTIGQNLRSRNEFLVNLTASDLSASLLPYPLGGKLPHFR